MASARCPVCENFITFGIPLKFHQSVTCPTCLASLQVVSVNPFELDRPVAVGALPSTRNNRHSQGRNLKDSGKRRISDYLGGADEEEYEEFDDYILERRLRHKSERDKHKKEESW